MKIHEIPRSEANTVKGKKHISTGFGIESDSSLLNDSSIQNSSVQPSSRKPLSDDFNEPLLTNIPSESFCEPEKRGRSFARNPCSSGKGPNGDNDQGDAYALENENLSIQPSCLENQLDKFDVSEGHKQGLPKTKIQKEKRKAGRPKKLSYVAEDILSEGLSHKRRRGRPRGWRKHPERDVCLEMIDAPVEKHNPKSVFEAVVVPLNSVKNSLKQEIANEPNDRTWDFEHHSGMNTDVNMQDGELEDSVPGLTFDSSIGPSSCDLPNNNESLNVTKSDPDSDTNFSFSDDDFAVLDKIEHEFEIHDTDQPKSTSPSSSPSHRITLCENNEALPQKSVTEIKEIQKNNTLNSRKENNNIFQSSSKAKAHHAGMRFHVRPTFNGRSNLEAKSIGKPSNFKYPSFLKSSRNNENTSSARNKPLVRSPFAQNNSGDRIKQTLSKPFRPPLKKDALHNIIEEGTEPESGPRSSRMMHLDDANLTNDGHSSVVSRLQSEVSNLQDQVSIVELAYDLENTQEDEVKLYENIQRWRRSAQLAVEVLFPVFSLKFTTMLQEVPESVLPSVVDDLRSKPCNIGTYLEQLNIPFSLLNYNPENDSWGDET
ncbi:Swi5 complex subunit Swi2 [Schizosaccharomyces cryophilus OY26]|uniref:Swi5 complex subunit Swi2 n=1 Tax=Schizosaccharomyces cryophilus (strain OY26 / ATCC MYA-4695 / CBS 11777 / NBRC 106824 / NRRL Y48691) TaxID=653667 RepID=S9VYQ7_SCHCR|nr:Swi5 complex subunit Swi2 [Schizosaccharomyces cryophilus OY26]EPY52793.1 Swi5 complex subunit Swi2 [Schizosaccharomyces cryophilus OY26]